MLLILSSKHLPFLSGDIVHHKQGGIMLHHFLWLLVSPLLVQQLNKSAVCSGINHFILALLKTRDYSCAVNLQWRNSGCLSLFSQHKKHLEAMWNFLFWSTSWVRQALLTTSQEKYLTFVCAKLLHTCFRGPGLNCVIPSASFLQHLLTENCPSLSCFQMILSDSVLLKPSNSLINSTKLLTSQLFKCLNVISHPWRDQLSASVMEGLEHMLNKSGYVCLRVSWPIHRSSQNRILVPLPTL